ncbi:hypothetical protein KUTeg_020812 [Tegillarca granosa]|uniref:Uncharacterized protein n=1 Tax=Tegillarca granosa TaxID=220873 RepID=A0ABQ9EEA9_TEGGR|nr:hypothetical protein KUTeg_020812 [Tegillarca granosa]
MLILPCSSPESGGKYKKNNNMVKLLQDICLDCIQKSLDRIPHAGSRLPTIYKEKLLERLASHDLLTPEYLPHVSYNLFVSNLRHINFYKCSQINNTVLQQLAASKCVLEDILIHGCENVSDVGVQAITQGQVELKELILRKLPQLTTKGLINLKSPKLCKLDLRGCSSLHTDFVASMATVMKNNPTIQSITMSNCNKMEDAAVKVIINNLNRSLEELDCLPHTLSDDSLAGIANSCPYLKRLNLHGCSRLSGEGLIQLSQGCTKLECLDLSYCSTLSKKPDNESLWTLPTSLVKLSLCGVRLDDERILVECVQRLKCLKSLRLCGVTCLNDKNFEQIDVDVLFVVASTCYNLEILDMAGLACVTNDLLVSLAEHCPKLSKLGIKGCSEVTDMGVCAVARRCPLKKIVVSGINNLTDKSIFTLANQCCNLEELYVNGCSLISPTTLRYLVDCCLSRVYIQHVTPNVIPNQLMGKNLDTGEFCRVDMIHVP